MQKFLNHFTGSRAHRKTVASLYNLNQGDSESLKDFIKRFNRKTAQIRNLNQEIVLYAFARALNPSPFAESLDIYPKETLHKLRTRAASYIRAKEEAEKGGNERGEVKETNQPPWKLPARSNGEGYETV